MSSSTFKSKLSNFQDRFKNLLGAKSQGYDELSTLERPLVSDVHEQEEYERQHGVAAAGGAHTGYGGSSGAYRPPAPVGDAAYYPPQPGHPGGAGYPPPPGSGAAGYPPPPGAARMGRVSNGPMPSQIDEMQELSLLARDAAEILWEMVAMGESGAAVADMKSKGEELQAQLRGLIGDYQGGDEAVFAKAFESFDMLSRCLEEQNAPPAAQAPAAALAAPPPSVEAPAPAISKPATDEAPLISFD